ncbi:MAG: hypothetical protein ACLFVZ_09345 [Actinomycetota bacterium]
MMSRIIARLALQVAALHNDERGEVNASMISWMVVTVLVIFAFRTQLASILTAAAGFVTTTLGI